MAAKKQDRITQVKDKICVQYEEAIQDRIEYYLSELISLERHQQDRDERKNEVNAILEELNKGSLKRKYYLPSDIQNSTVSNLLVFENISDIK